MSSAIAVTLVIIVLVVGAVCALVIASRHMRLTQESRLQITSSDEYRRLSEMAITAQEHTDLKLGEVNMQLAQLRNQLEQVQKILKDVE